MRHVGCGGVVRNDWGKTYDYTDDEGHTSKVPSVVCQKCGQEILGDSMVQLDTDIALALEPPKVYLGDSVYAEHTGDAVRLTTENGLSHTNTIYLEFEVIQKLRKFLQERGL